MNNCGMKTMAAISLAVIGFSSIAIAQDKPSFYFGDAEQIRQELRTLSARVDALERSHEETLNAVKQARDSVQEASQAVKALQQYQLNTLEEIRETNELMRKSNQPEQQQYATSTTTAPIVIPVSTPVLQVDTQPYPTSWDAYRNSEGKLPSTSVGGRTITASPAYTYYDSNGNLVRDYPVSISASPPVNVPVTVSMPPMYSTPAPVTYQRSFDVRRGLFGSRMFGSVSACGPGGCF